ncbi:pantoate--beta-alanine ligase [soil metagenome]
MLALPDGHEAVVRCAGEEAGPGGTVVVSIFVNPTQFGPEEDFENYPRDLQTDAALVSENGGDIVFAPPAETMYAPDRSVRVEETTLSKRLCGASRPGHFAGVCLVVLKLFHIVEPGVAVFGKKDFQQMAVVRRMVRDLDLPVRVVGAETVREPDGLAMSSRNRYLNAEERRQAATLRRALVSCRESGEREAAALVAAFRSMLASDAPLGRIDYAEVVGAEDLQPLGQIDQPAVMAVAVYFGRARLIDNIELSPS